MRELIANRLSSMPLHCVLLLLSAAWLGCGSGQVEPVESKQAVYVDTETLQAVVRECTAQTPAVNPTTGKRTLMPAMYCPTCACWHAVPAPEQINRSPGATTCPKTGVALIADGPWPH